MSETERHLTIVVATTKFDYYQDYDECAHELHSEQKSYALDELLCESWFLDMLRGKGFYSKDELSSPLEYLDKFVYKYKTASWDNFATSVNSISEHYEITGVYQEVIGPERIKAFAKWKKKRKAYLEKQAELNKKNLVKKELAKEKRRLKEIAKAKKILEEEGVSI